jgi:D-psicose/D-tagatose/L-ribulose 3-epimerase
MNKIGIYYAYWTKNWDADFLEFVPKVANLGFDTLEVNSGTVTNMTDAERDKLKQAALEYNIELTFCIGLTKEYDIASEDNQVRKKGIEFMKRQAEMLHYMGARKLGGIIYGAWPGKLPDGVFDKRPWFDRSVKSMAEIIKTAENLNVYLNVEVVNRFEQFILNTCDEAIGYLNQVDSNNLKILLDTFHMNIEEDSISEAIMKAGKKLGHFHIGETNRKAPGRGHMPWDEICTALKKINYTDTITMEPFLIPGGEVGRDIQVYRNLNNDIKDMNLEAKRALLFIRDKLEKTPNF